MEKKGRMNWVVGCACVAVVFIAVDPMGMGPLGGYKFEPVKHNIAPYEQVMGNWPRDLASRLRFSSLQFRNQVYGPESLEFDSHGRGPYAGFADGRVMRWSNHTNSWELFAVSSAQWNAKSCERGNKSTTKEQWEHEGVCGRPLGLRFERETGDLYYADAYYGLMRVGSEGGVAQVVSDEAGGKPIKFANDLDIHSNGSIFFTDSSQRYMRKDNHMILLEGENTGRLLRYDPSTKTTSVVLENLSFPNGVQLSHDQAFILLSETTNCRILRLWIEEGRLEVFVDLPGFPDNIRINENGEFWVAIDCCRKPIQEWFSRRPLMRKLFFKLPVPISLLYKIAGMRMFTIVARFDGKGSLLDSLEDRDGHVVKLVSEVYEKDNHLWIGTVCHNHIAKYALK